MCIQNSNKSCTIIVNDTMLIVNDNYYHIVFYLRLQTYRFNSCSNYYSVLSPTNHPLSHPSPILNRL